MTAAPGNDEKWQMELSQSSYSSSLDYSEDTFERFSEEEGSCWQRESEPAESCCSTEGLEGSAVSDTVESSSWLAGQKHAAEKSRAVDPAAVERDVMGKWIDLQNKETGIKRETSAIRTGAGLTEVTELLGGELDALRSFCTVKISRMCQPLMPEQPNAGESRTGPTAKKPETSDLNCLVPEQLMNRIRLKNIRETVRQVTEAQIHEPSKCPDCQKKEAELAQITFLRQKKTLMESALIQEKLEEQIYFTGSQNKTLQQRIMELFKLEKPFQLRHCPCTPAAPGRAYTYRRSTEKLSQTFRGSQELMAKAEKSENLRLEVVTVTPGRKGLGEQQSCTECQ